MFASVHATRRMREGWTPVTLAKEQRMSVMSATVREVFCAP